jgi:phospholipase/carboxylesterase
MQQAVIIQQPTASAAQLLLLFHGVGGTPRDMAPVGQRLAVAFPQALIVSVAGAVASDVNPAGYQWFSVQGITEENRPARVAAAMPAFVQSVQHWQQVSGLSAMHTAIVGFSQGAIMALESTQQAPALAGRVIAIAGRYAVPPQSAPPDTTLHFLHGKEDAVIPYRHIIDAANLLIALGADLTADVIPFLGHGINPEVMDLVVSRLCEYVPKRTWDEALRSAGDPSSSH